MPTFINKFGRSGGRGWRPFVLVPKVLAVALYFGGLAAALVACDAALRDMTATPGLALPMHTVVLLHRLFVCLIVPALLLAMLLGAVLTLQHPRQFVRLRWWQAKLALIVVAVPVAHLYMSHKLGEARLVAQQHLRDPATLEEFRAALLCVIVGSAVAIVLGRVKPNLRQNWARGYAKSIGR